MSSMLPPLILELRAHAGQVKTELAGVEKEIGHLEKKAGGMSGFQKGFNRAALAGKYLAGGITAAGAVVGYESVKMAANFQQASLHLVTDAGESQKNLKMVQNGMLDLSAQTGISADDIAKGMYLVESAGYHGKKGLDVMKAAAEGAKIGGADLNTVADALTTTMTDYGKSVGTPAQVTSKLIATVGQGKTTMEALAGSLHNVMPTAASLGINFNQVAGAMATMTAEGVSADQASQNLNHAINSLANPTQVQTKEMAAMGLNSTTVAQQLGKKGLTGTLDTLVTAITTHMGKGGLVLQKAFEQSQLAAQSANTMFQHLPKSVQDVAKAYEKGTITQKDWTTAIKGMTPANANLAKQWATSQNAAHGFSATLKSNQGLAQTFTGALSKMTGGQQGLSVALHLTGDHMATFKDNVKIVGKASNEAGGHVKGWKDTQKLLNVQIDQAKASIEKMGIKIGTVLIPMVSKALKGAEGFIGYLMKHKGVLIAIAAVIGTVVVGAIGAYVASLVIAGIQSVSQLAKMSASVVKWGAKTSLTIAKALLQWAAFGAKWVAEQVAAGAKFIAGAAKSAAKWLAEQTAAMAKAIARWAAFTAKWIAEQAKAGAKLVADAAKSMGKWVATQSVAFSKAIAKGAAYAATSAVQGAKAAAVWMASSAKTIAALARQGVALLAQKGVMIASAAITGIATAAQWAWNAAMDANPIGIVILAIAALIAIIILVATHWKQITNFLVQAWQKVSDFFQSIGRTIAGWWNDFWNSKIGGFLKSTFGPIINWVRDTFQKVVGFFESIGGDVASAWNNIWSGISSTVQTAFNGAISIVEGAVNTITGAINTITAGINSVTSLGSAIGINVPKIPQIPSLGGGGGGGGGASVSTGHMHSFAVGGTIPGPTGAPIPIIAHGGEEMVSLDMLAGRKAMPARVQQAMAQPQTVQQQPGGRQQTVIVNAQTNATPNQIASSVGWQLRLMG